MRTESQQLFLVKNPVPLSFDGPKHLYSLKERIDFRALGREQTAVFLTISGADRAMDKISRIFYPQALHALIESAGKDYRFCCALRLSARPPAWSSGFTPAVKIP